MLNRIAFLLLLCLAALWACQPETQQAEADAEVLMDGEALARIHCGSCHQYPEPKLLDQASWNKHILPRMGYMLGVLPEDSIGADYIEAAARDIAFANPMLFRKEAPVSMAQWQEIRSFYMKNAPEAALRAPVHAPENRLPVFKVKKPGFQLSPPSVTMARFVGSDILIGDANTQQLFQFDKNLQLQKQARLKEGIVDVTATEPALLLTLMGSFSPTDQQSGMVIALPTQQQSGVKILLDSLRRPVHTSYADLNADGRLDMVTCEFAKWTGKLSWWERQADGQFKERILRNMPGAMRTYIHDFNQDQKPDIIALFGQGDEGFFIYYNEGNGQFREERILTFPPSYGSSYFHLFDYNQDGHADIIYTAGDNADFPPIVKAYHGIRIFVNDGNNQFEEAFFYPMYGAYSAIPEDFDQDGDLDIAAISFFPDFSNEPQAAFLYLENQGNGAMKSYSFPEVNDGRWIVMDSEDYDADGDLDLLLGSLAFEVVPPVGLVDEWVKNGLPFLILENTLR